jgi:excisionase family DNA binding protein
VARKRETAEFCLLFSPSKSSVTKGVSTPMIKATTRLITIPEFSRRTGVHHAAVRDAIRTGQLPAIRIGQRDRIPEDAVERVLASGKKNDK